MNCPSKWDSLSQDKIMVETIRVDLNCCGAQCEVRFDDSDCPIMAPGGARKNVTCPKCSSFLILSLLRSDTDRDIEQEIIEKK